jgi:surfactin synthase thioesterase subunit
MRKIYHETRTNPEPKSTKIINLPINGGNVKITAEQDHDITSEQVKEWADHIRNVQSNFLRGTK